MPRLRNRLPKLQHHKASGRAFVWLGRRVYLGRWDGRPPAPVAIQRAHAKAVANYTPTHTSIRRQRSKMSRPAWRRSSSGSGGTPRTTTASAAKPTTELARVRSAMRFLRQAAEGCEADRFNVANLREVRDAMIAAGLARSTINAYVSIIRRMFRWSGAEGGMTRPGIWAELQDLAPLQRGRSAATETDQVQPVSVATVLRTLPHLPATARELVRFISVTGCRPEEACTVRACDIGDHERLGRVYRPERHKCEHHGHERIVPLSAAAMAILTPLLNDAAPTAFLFPLPMSRGRYNRTSLNRSITRACDRAFPAPENLTPANICAWRIAHRWHTNQLRHMKLTEMRHTGRLEAAQIQAGHASARMTEHYAKLSADPLDVDSAFVWKWKAGADPEAIIRQLIKRSKRTRKAAA